MERFFFVLFFVAVIAVSIPVVLAQGTVELDIAERAARLYEWGIGIGVIVALGILTYAGFVYTTSAGNASRIGDAKKWIIAGLSGLLILFSSFLLLNTINPDLTNLESIFIRIAEKGKFTPPKLTLPDPGIVASIPPSSVVNGTYSCVWDENAVLSQRCKPAIFNACNGGFVPGNACAPNAEREQCEAVQERICVWQGGTSYDIFAAVARSYTVDNVRIAGNQYPVNAPHQAYVVAEPTDRKTTNTCFGAECGVYVATVVRNTIDPNFPRSYTGNQGPYMRNNPQIYEMIYPLSSIQIRPGDILIDAPAVFSGTGEHVAIWLDDGEYEAGWNGGPAGLPGSSNGFCGDGYLPKGPRSANEGGIIYSEFLKNGVAFRYRGFIPTITP